MKKNFALTLLLILLLAIVGTACQAQPAEPPPPEEDAESGEADVADMVDEEEAAEEELIPVDFRLNWTLYGEHAPFFLGVDNGFYEAEGLDVTILEGSGSSTVIKLLGRGENVIGYADTATMMRGVTQGVPVKSVAVIFQTSPQSFIYRADSPIAGTIEEIPGTSVAITAGDASLAFLEACLGRNNLTTEDINLVVVSNPAAKETAVLEGQADTFMGYFVDQPLRMEKTTGVEMQWTTLADICGVNTLSSAIIVNNEWAEDNPEIVEKFVRASQRAWAYTQEHPDEAAEIFAQHAEAFDVPLSLDEIEGSLTLLHTENSQGEPIGWVAPEDVQASQDVLSQYAGLNPEEDINLYYTNDFISQPPYEPAGSE